jgi:hypothetical protein
MGHEVSEKDWVGKYEAMRAERDALQVKLDSILGGKIITQHAVTSSQFPYNKRVEGPTPQTVACAFRRPG